MLKRIHINQHNIRKNNNGENVPVITVKTYKDNIYGFGVDILGESEVIYSQDKPLSCGAKVWIETRGKVKIYNKNGKLKAVI